MSDWLRDAQAAARGLRSRPGFAAVSVLTLALGIGANTAIFSLVDAVLLEPLPFPEPEQLVRISETAMRERLELRSLSYPMLRDLRRDGEVLEEVAAIFQIPLNVSEEGEPERILGEAVTPSYFRLLGMRHVLGRLLDDEDDGLDLLHPSVVLAEEYWQRRFGGDPAVVGRDIVLNEVACTVVGVVGGSGLSGDASVFVPLETAHHLVPRVSTRRYEARGARWLDAIGRVRPDVTPEVLEAWMERESARLRNEFPDVMENRGVTAFPLESQMLGDVQRTALLLTVAVGLVMLIVCANLANLMLARSVRRRREVALRFALGATRWRVLRGLMTESLLLSVAGGLAGVLLALWTRDLLRGSGLFGRLPDYVVPGFDITTLTFATALSLVTAVLFGSVPALASMGAELSTTMKGGSPGREAGGGGGTLGLTGGLFVTVQVALAVSLTIASALVVQSLVRQSRIEPGFRATDVYTMRVQLPQKTYDADGARGFSRELLERLTAIAGVRSVALSSDVPLVDGYSAFTLRTEGQARRDPEDRFRAYHHEVSPGFFSTMGISLLRGRDFTSLDSQEAPLVVIVSEKLARVAWPGEEPVGKRISVNGPNGPWREVVGLVADVRYRDLVLDPMLNPDDPDVYLPLSQAPRSQIAIVVNVSGASEGPVVSGIREEVRALDAGMPVFGVASMTDVLAEELALSRVASFLLGSFGVVAVLLACLGLYGLLSHWVAERSRDIGIRMALGAGAGRIVVGVLRRGMGLVGLGLLAGVLLALALSRFLESRLYEVSATDGLTFATSALVLAIVGLLSTYLPARRATHLSPIVVLKQE